MISNKVTIGLRKPLDETKITVMEIDQHLHGKLTIPQMNDISLLNIARPLVKKSTPTLDGLQIDDNVKQVFVYIQDAPDTVVCINSPQNPKSDWITGECKRLISEYGPTNLVVIAITDPVNYSTDGDNQAYLLTINFPGPTVRSI